MHSPADASLVAVGPKGAGRIALPPNAMPLGFVEHAFELEFTIETSRARVWAWLDDPETFMRGQVWPFRVEFLSPNPDVAAGFSEGGVNVHSGPLLCLPGVLNEITEGRFRDLRYFYGSYVGSVRLLRPTRLAFWVADGSATGTTTVKVRLESFVHRRIARLWTAAQGLFWRRFQRWMSRALEAPLYEPRGGSAR
jgi:hypothetical protein